MGRAWAVLLLACAILAGPPATGHAPTPGFVGEGPGFTVATYSYDSSATCMPEPGGALDCLRFIGIGGTEVADKPCPEVLDSQWNNAHIGHINAVTSLNPGTGSNTGLTTGSVNLFHFGDPGVGAASLYENPAQIENNGAVSANGVMMWTDGYFRGAWTVDVVDTPNANDFRVGDVHQGLAASYCIWGAMEERGPYFFIDGTSGDGVNAGSGSYADIDLAWYYRNLYLSYYPTETQAKMHYVLFQTSFYDDPVPPPVTADAFGPYAGASGDVVPITGAGFNGVGPYTCVWSATGVTLGDSTSCNTTVSRTISCPTLSSVAVLTLTVTDAIGQTASDTASLSVSRTCPPTAIFTFTQADSCTDVRVTFDAGASSDPDGGTLTQYVWDFGDGSTATLTTPTTLHEYAADGLYMVTVTVTDNEGETGVSTAGMVQAKADYNCPPSIDNVPGLAVLTGALVQFTVTGADPDGDPLTFSAFDLPAGAVFDAASRSFSWTPGTAGTFCFSFRVSDGVAHATTRTCIQVNPESYDADRDGMSDEQDNCPDLANPSQADADGDGLGDACDPQPGIPSAEPSPGRRTSTPVADMDMDGIADDQDNCPAVANASQTDADGNGIGDHCETLQAMGGAPPVQQTSTQALSGPAMECPSCDAAVGGHAGATAQVHATTVAGFFLALVLAVVVVLGLVAWAKRRSR